MPKPLEGVQGSGMHTHVSLFEGDENAFHDPGDPYNLSKVAKGFIAGLLHHAHEITAVTNQTVNSYKRLIPGFEAPAYVSWARNNRSALVRVPVTKRKPQSTRVEYRAPDPACNPYLAFSVILAAGLAGIEEGYELPPDRPPTSSSSPTRSAPQSDYSHCRSRLPSRSPRWSSPNSSPPPWGSTSSSGSSATSAGSGGLQRARDAVRDRPLPAQRVMVPG